jgi:DNA-binding transcriptional regulator YdaS (Cro superfamily)
MMTLDKYLAANGTQTLTALSAALGVSKGRLSQLRYATEWPPELALKVERETDGALSASALSSVVADARVERAA